MEDKKCIHAFCSHIHIHMYRYAYYKKVRFHCTSFILVFGLYTKVTHRLKIFRATVRHGMQIVLYSSDLFPNKKANLISSSSLSSSSSSSSQRRRLKFVQVSRHHLKLMSILQVQQLVVYLRKQKGSKVSNNGVMYSSICLFTKLFTIILLGIITRENNKVSSSSLFSFLRMKKVYYYTSN